MLYEVITGLSLSTFGILPELTHKLAAYSEFCIALLSFYGSAASVFNNHLGKVFLPVGKPFGLLRKRDTLVRYIKNTA